MKKIMKNSPLAIVIFIIGAAIVVGGILTMALYHDMSWQSYVIIGCIMLASIWAMINIPVSISIKQKESPVRIRSRR